jgi:hypothetical protein
MLAIPDKLYKEQKLPNMCLLLNGTDSRKGMVMATAMVKQSKEKFGIKKIIKNQNMICFKIG